MAAWAMPLCVVTSPRVRKGSWLLVHLRSVLGHWCSLPGRMGFKCNCHSSFLGIVLKHEAFKRLFGIRTKFKPWASH